MIEREDDEKRGSVVHKQRPAAAPAWCAEGSMDDLDLTHSQPPFSSKGINDQNWIAKTRFKLI